MKLSHLVPALALAASGCVQVKADPRILTADSIQRSVVTIYNNTDTTITEFYASIVQTNNWEENMLANGSRAITIAPGGSVDLDFRSDRACLYDFLAVFADGEEVISYNENVCAGDSHEYVM